MALLSAPAGYGKSTLAAQYAARRRALWCRLDRDDRDLDRLFGRLLGAGLRHRPPLAIRTERLFLARRDMERDGGLLTASLLREIVPVRGSRLVVVEDLHLLAGGREALAWLRRLLDESGPGLRFLLTCRGVCPLPLARYEAQGGVVRLGPEELAFDDEEQDRFLRRASEPELSPREHGALRDSLRGWPAGFALLVHSPPDIRPPRLDAGSAGEDRTARLFRYLAEEIFSPLPVSLQAALCRVSLLEELEPEAIDLLLGPAAGARLRRELVRSQLLVRPLPDRPGVAAFHPLFREFLKERREAFLPATEARRLGRRLAQSLLRRGESARAMRAHLEVGDAAGAVACFDRTARRETSGSPPGSLIPVAVDMLHQLPADGSARRSPWLLSAAAAGLYKDGRYAEAADLVGEAQELWLRVGAYPEVARAARLAAACAWVTGRSGLLVSRLEAYLARCPTRDRLSRAILMAEIGGLRLLAGQPGRALRELARAERVLRGTPHELQLVEIRLSRANVLYAEGRWDQYLETAQQALSVFRRAGLPGRCQSILINMAEAHTYLGEEDRALSLLDEAAALPTLLAQPNLALIELGRARALVERGEADAASESLQGVRELARRQRSFLWELQADLWTGVLERRRGRLEAARAALSDAVEGFRKADSPAWRNVAEMELALVLGLLRQEGALRTLRAAARVSGSLGDAKELARNLLYQARVLHASARPFEPVLRRALRLLERERYLVLLRKENDLARPLLQAMPAISADLHKLVQTAMPAAVPPGDGPHLVVRLLGGMEVTLHGRRIAFPRRASRELVARLALRPGESFRREELAEALWPGAPPESSRNRFDVALSGARRLLEPEAGPRGPFRVLESGVGWCRLAADAVQIDAREFDAAAQRCRALLRDLRDTGRSTGDRPARRSGGSGRRGVTAARRRAAAELSRAARLYSGDLLPEWPQVEWTRGARERLQAQFRSILLERAALCLQLGETAAAEGDARRALEGDPLDETAQRVLLAALAARGDHLAVIRSYRAFARRVRRELGVPPSPETTARFHESVEAARRSGKDRRRCRRLELLRWRAGPPHAESPRRHRRRRERLLRPGRRVRASPRGH